MSTEKVLASVILGIFLIFGLTLYKNETARVVIVTATLQVLPTVLPTILSQVLPTSLHFRSQIPSELNRRGFKVGAELGVQAGAYSLELLQGWPLCEKLYLIDVWKPQINYFDSANVDQKRQDSLYKTTIKRVSPYGSKVQILRMTTTEAAKLIPNLSLDFVYVDARHDYCGVMEDLVNYYPKLRSGGIMSGHDYKTAAEVRLINRNEEWGICENGTRHEGSVKGAVDDFIKSHKITNLQITSGDLWASWLFIKK
jgi:hypothetical protein